MDERVEHLPLTHFERNHLRTLFAECNPRGSKDTEGCRVCAEIDAWRARESLEAVEEQEPRENREVAIKLCAALEYLRDCECNGKSGADDPPILEALEAAREAGIQYEALRVGREQEPPETSP